MKHIIFLIACFFTSIACYSQKTVNIKPGTFVLGRANVQVSVKSDSFANNGNYIDTTGTLIIWRGVIFSGSGATQCHNLIANTSDTVVFNSQVSVYNTCTHAAGVLNANNNLYIRSDANAGANMVVTGVLYNNVRGLIAKASATSGSCPSFSSNLSLVISGPAILYQWQSSPDSITWSSLSGATLATYTATVTTTSYYRCSLTANNSTFSEVTPGLKLTITGTVPAAIAGVASVCAASATNLTDAVTGGTWSSSATAVATVVAGTGVVTGVASGTSTITYTSSSGCYVTTQVTVNAVPTTVTASGGGTFCGSTTITAANGSSGTIYYQGTTSGGTSTATTSTSQVVSSSGTYYFRAKSAAGCWGTEGSVAVTINALPTTVTASGGGTYCGSATITAANGGSGTIYYQGTTFGGTSTATASASQVVSSSGTYYFRAQSSAGCWGTEGSVTVTINPLPSAITGIPQVCPGTNTTLSDATAGAWSSSNTNVSIGSISGVVTGIASGSSVITYSIVSTGCYTVTTVTINPLPSSISGGTIVGAGYTLTLSDATGGGAWSSSNTANATIGTSSGVVTGVTVGTSVISYTLTATGCFATENMTINPVPTISVQPADRVGCLGYSSSCSVTAAPVYPGDPLAYQWRKSGVNITGATNSAYMINAVANTDTGTGIYSCVITENAISTFAITTSGSLIMNIGAIYLGSTTSWSTASNWSTGFVPDSTVHAYIPASISNMPDITSSTVKCKCLTIESGASLTVNGGTLEIAGRINNSGTFDATGGTIVINGTNISQTIPANTFTSNTINKLTIANTVGVSLAGDLKVTGTYTPAAGIFSTGGYLVLASSSSGTANVAQGSSSGGYVSGNVTVERYIPANSHRAWRLLSANTTGSQTIHAAWQEGALAMADPNPGYGTIIACDSRYNTSAGFDTLQPNMSILAFDVTGQSWTTNPVANTNVKTLSSEPGYFLYTCGERTVTTSTSITGSTATTLRSAGALLMGDQPAITVPANQYVLVGNPFASTIDFSLISGGDMPNVGNRVWLWDPQLTGSNGIGGYTLCDASTAPAWLPSVTGGSYSSAISKIPSGMAFFVKGSASSGSITLRENIKVSDNSNNGFRLTGSSTEQFQVIMSVVNPDGTHSNADGVFALFNDKYSAAVDNDDADKLSNTGENLAILRNGNTLTLEARPVVTTDDTVFLAITKMKPINYRFTVTPTGFSAAGLTTGIVDNYLNTFTPIDLSTPTTYDFSVNADNGSFDKNRFYIDMHQSTSGQPNITSENGITVYPNPTDNAHINVQFTNMEKGTYSLTLYNSIGQKTLIETVIYPGGTVTKQLRSENITPGMYHLSVDKNASFYKSFKIIITQ